MNFFFSNKNKIEFTGNSEYRVIHIKNARKKYEMVTANLYMLMMSLWNKF